MNKPKKQEEMKKLSSERNLKCREIFFQKLLCIV